MFSRDVTDNISVQETIDILPLFDISLVGADMSIANKPPVPIDFEITNGKLTAIPDNFPLFGSPTNLAGSLIEFTLSYSDCALDSVESGLVSESCNAE